MTPRNKKTTPETRKIEALLRGTFPKAEAYRYNSASIRVRIIDDQFAGKTRSEREDLVWPLLEQLPEETRADIMIVLMLSPDEIDDSHMNLEFEKPSPSRL
jgi:stress-induced morphogen